MAKVVAYIDKVTNTKESVDDMLKRFKKKVTQEEILLDCRKHEYFVKKSLKRKEKSILAKKKQTKNYKPKY